MWTKSRSTDFNIIIWLLFFLFFLSGSRHQARNRELSGIIYITCRAPTLFLVLYNRRQIVWIYREQPEMGEDRNKWAYTHFLAGFLYTKQKREKAIPYPPLISLSPYQDNNLTEWDRENIISGSQLIFPSSQTNPTFKRRKSAEESAGTISARKHESKHLIPHPHKKKNPKLID